MHFALVISPGDGIASVDAVNIDPKSPTEESWAWIREPQLKVLDLPYTSIVNTIDSGDLKNIHPIDKCPIAQRLALQVAKYTLNKDVVAEGPTMHEVVQNDNKLINVNN